MSRPDALRCAGLLWSLLLLLRLGRLRRSGLRVSPPEPCTTDSETITFVGKVDAAAVQGLLNQWAGRRPLS